jgi:dTDP-4-dehydrorhamnose 3,5-epimerase
VRFEPLDVAGAFLVHPEPRGDERGWFARVFCAEEFVGHGLDPTVAQINLAQTAAAGTVRGLHFQLPPAAEAKLVRCVAGAIFDVVLDNRPASPTFGRWAGAELTADDGTALYVPTGCAHGYQALTDGARALYHASMPYTPELERGIDHADATIGIAWPLPPVHVSYKDRRLPPLRGAELPPATGSLWGPRAG